MRSFSWVLLAVLMAAFLAACGGDGDNDDDDSNDRPRRTATAAESAEPGGDEPAATPEATVTPSRPPELEPFPARNVEQLQRDTCGTYTVVRERITELDAAQAQDKITLLDAAGEPSAEILPSDPFSAVGVDWCFDMTGEGDPELSVYTFTGGAHCCITQTIYALGPERTERLLEFNAGNAGAMTPADLDGETPHELVGLDDRFANFEELPFAVSPYIAIVVAERGGQWVEVTTEFPELVRGHREGLLADADLCSPDAPPECFNGLGLGIMADSLLIGDWETFKQDLELPDETLLWLELRLDAVRARLAEPKLAAE